MTYCNQPSGPVKRASRVWLIQYGCNFFARCDERGAVETQTVPGWGWFHHGTRQWCFMVGHLGGREDPSSDTTTTVDLQAWLVAHPQSVFGQQFWFNLITGFLSDHVFTVILYLKSEHDRVELIFSVFCCFFASASSPAEPSRRNASLQILTIKNNLRSSINTFATNGAENLLSQ